MASYNQWAALKTILTTGFTIGNVNTNGIITVEPGIHRADGEVQTSTDYWLELEQEFGPDLTNNSGKYADEKYVIDAILKNRVDSIRPPYDDLIVAYALLFKEYRRLITANNPPAGTTWDAIWEFTPSQIKGDNPVRMRFTAIRPGADQS